MALHVTLIRHGETDDNRNQIIQGQKDTPLNALGVEQARLTGQHLRAAGVVFEEVWSSDLQRARKTAELIVAELPQPLTVQTDIRLRERFLGDLEGKRRQPGADQSSAEPPEAVLGRLLDFWGSEILSRKQHGKVLIVSHGAALRSLVHSGLVGRLGYEVVPSAANPSFANCSITQVEISDGRKTFLAVGRCEHLSGKVAASKTNADDIVQDAAKAKA